MMEYIRCIFFVYLCAVVETRSIRRDLLVIYGTGNGEIRLKDVLTQETLSTFKIQIDEITGGLAINYENDTIFFADDTKIYQMYLIDDFGQRRVSGKGELFTNRESEHFEIILFDFLQDGPRDTIISGLFFDDQNATLYALVYNKWGYYSNKIIKIHTDSGSLGRSVMQANSKYLHPDDFVIDNDKAYIAAFCQDSFKNPRYDKSEICIYRTKGHDFGSLSKLVPLVQGTRVNISAFAIDKYTNRLFYAQRNTIQVINLINSNLTSVNDTETNMNNDTIIVIADSRVTKGVKAIGVHGEVVIWSSSVLNGLFVGTLNENGTFISTKNVYKIDGSNDDEVKPRNIIIFERKYHVDKEENESRLKNLPIFNFVYTLFDTSRNKRDNVLL